MGHFVRYDDDGVVVATGTMNDRHIDALRASGEKIARASGFVPLDGGHEFSHAEGRVVRRDPKTRRGRGRPVAKKDRPRTVRAEVVRTLVALGFIKSKRELRALLRRRRKSRA